MMNRWKLLIRLANQKVEIDKNTNETLEKTVSPRPVIATPSSSKLNNDILPNGKYPLTYILS